MNGLPDAVFTTPRLTLGTRTHQDAATLLDIYSRWEVARWLGADPRPLTCTEEAVRLADHWGNGYATEAAPGAIARGLAAGLPEVLAVVRPDNAASQAVCRRLGMQARGLSERYYGTALEVFSATADGVAAPAPVARHGRRAP